MPRHYPKQPCKHSRGGHGHNYCPDCGAIMRRALLEAQLRDLNELILEPHPLHDVGTHPADGTMLEVQPGSLAPRRKSDLAYLACLVRDELDKEN